MAATAGRAFTLAEEYKPLPGCTTSSVLVAGRTATTSAFALAPGTDISAESYDYPKLLVAHAGTLVAYDDAGAEVRLATGEALLTHVGTNVGIRSQEGCTYTETIMGKDTTMNEAVGAGQAFRLAELVPYQDGTIVNMDVAHSDGMKLALMSFDAGCSLAEHAAPAEALVLALEGEGVIGYEGQEHVVHAGESFKFDKGGRHYVRAEQRFKMALLLVRE